MSIFGTAGFVIGTQANPSVSGSFNVAVGDVIVVFGLCFSFAGTMSTPTDTAGNTYLAIGSQFSTPGGNPINAWYSIATAAKTGNVVSVAASNTVRQCGFLHIPCSGTAVLDTSTEGSITTSSTAFPSPSINTTGTDELVVIMTLNDGSVAISSAPSGYTIDGNRFDSSQIASMFHDLLTSTQSGYTPTVTYTAAAKGGIMLFAFKSFVATYSISGALGSLGAGATVAYTGTASGSVTADGSGNYTIPSLANGSYTITPSKGGYVFSPSSSPQTVSGSNITGVNFTTSAAPTGAEPIVILMQ